MTLGPLCSFAAKGPWLGSFRKRKHCPGNWACESDPSVQGFILGVFVTYIHRRIDGLAPSPPSPSSPSLSMSSSPPSRRRRRIFATSITSSPTSSISLSLLLFLSLSRSREGGGRRVPPFSFFRQREGGGGSGRQAFKAFDACSSFAVPHLFFIGSAQAPDGFLLGSYFVDLLFIGCILFVSYSIHIA